MTKQLFLSSLREKMQGLPKEDLEERLNFYSEMIDDRMDDGKTEEEAVAAIGDVDQIIEEIAREVPLTKLVKERIKPKRKLKAWEIVLLILGFPLWFPLVLTALILAFVFYLLIWVLVIVCYAVEIGLVGASLYGIIAFFLQVSTGEPGALYIGIAVMSAGGAVLLYFGCVEATKATLKFSKMLLTKIKKLFIKKGE